MSSKFSEKEAEILKFWQENKIFEKSLKKDSPKGDYVFYDGPPFATGTPHYGHIVASLMKDVVPRFWTMNGYHVERKWGWDTHGLPIENLIEKEKNIESKKDIVEKIGVKVFNQACHASVMKYADVWEKFIPKMGRWVDMEHDYKTMDLNYMESIWWVFKTLYEKDLIYEGYKTMHICPRCETTLSQSEVTEGYKDVTEISVTIKFELVGQPGTYVLAWTTTPWTLPGNVGLAVGENIDYVKVKTKDGNYLILGKERLEILDEDYEIVEEMKGKKLKGLSYKPLYEIKELQNENSYKIILADFVTTEDGTGVVHTAVMYGEDDYRAGMAAGLPAVHTVGEDGKFLNIVPKFSGKFVKSAEKDIISDLKERNLLFATQEFTHSYPFCWRCETPLLNYATSSWFVKVTEIKDKALKLAKEIYWFPPHLKEGRFGNWLEGAKDWSISRQRFWGSVIPVWKCECGEEIVFGSIKDLEKASGQKIIDLHKHVIDEIKVNCPKCKKEVSRIPDVLDCWFESGSMPYAQVHYPFENQDWFEDNFPAEFIAEGVDQTRAWFYYLHIIATAIMGKPAFKNVIANGIVLAEDGKKMSKRLKNYPEPDLVVNQYGADAMRYYLLTSPVMAAETLNFSEDGVKEALQKNIMLVGNVLSFYLMYQKENPRAEIKNPKSKNILDKWIVAKLNVLNKEVTERMKEYDLVRATRPLGEFINELSTWYLRRSRGRFKEGDRDGIETLGYVLLEFSKLAAPFIPFTAESIYRKICNNKESVHLEDWSEFNKKAIDEKLLSEMQLVRQIVEQGLACRAQEAIKIRQPLSSYATSLTKKLDKDLVKIILEELNVKELILGSEEKLDTEITVELKQEGISRELIRHINQLRKESGLTIEDKIILYQQGLNEIFDKFGEDIKKATLTSEVRNESTNEMKDVKDGKIAIEKL